MSPGSYCAGAPSASARTSFLGENHVGRLDDRSHLVAFAQPQLLDRLDRDRCDEALTLHVDLDVRDRRALVDASNGPLQLIPCAQFHADTYARRLDGTLAGAPCL